MNSIVKDECPRRDGVNNVGFEYEYVIPALFALRTIDRSDIVDMFLATNVNDMGAFDDLILYLEYENSKKSVYIIQLKHIKAPITASLLKQSKDFGFNKYQTDYEKIIKHPNLSQLLENVGMEDIYFIIYSPAKLSLPLDEKIMKDLNLILIKENLNHKEFCLLNTNIESKECVYKFKKGKKNQKDINENFLSQFYLFTDQAQTDATERLIQKLINEKYGYQEENIKLNLLDYFKKWGRGDLRIHSTVEKVIEEGFKNSSTNFSINFQTILKTLKDFNLETHYKLRKRDFRLKLTELLLNPYVVKPKSFFKFKNGNLWNDIVNSVQVTIVEDYDEETKCLIWDAINTKLYSCCCKKLKGDSWEDDNWLVVSDLPNKYRQRGMEFLDKIKQISMKHLYAILWKIGCLPLLIKADDKAQVSSIVTALLISNDQDCKKHVILLYKTEDVNLCKLFKSYSVIQTLADVHDTNLLKQLLENMAVSLQERKPVKLSRLLNSTDDIFVHIPAVLVLIMLHRHFTAGRKCADLPENYIKRRIGKVLLRGDVLKLQKSVFIVYGCSDIQDVKSITDPWRVIDRKSFLKEASVKNDETDLPNVVALEEGREINSLKLQNVVSKSNGMHYLRYHNGYLEWIYSTAPINDIKEYVYKDTSDFIIEDNVLDHFSSKVNIISSNPGMGKSVIINCLAEKCWGDYWVEIISLSGDNDDIQKVVSMTPFSKSEEGSRSSYKNFKEALVAVLRTKRKMLYLIDAFDEVLPEQIKSVTAGLRGIKDKGFPLWITTRPIKSDYLERKMNALCLKLDYISVEDQIQFLKKYFYKREGNINLFIENLRAVLSKSFFKLDLEFSSVPLHLYMIAEVFEDKSMDEIISWKEINTIDLYESFILKKITVYLRKTLGDKQNRFYKEELQRTRTQHDQAALLIFYQRNILEQIIDLQKIDQFLEDTRSGEKNIGIITSIYPVRNIPVYIHRTFAEYLTAKFLASHFSNENIKPLLQLMFEEELTIIRELFDRILAKDNPLHLAVLNNNLEQLKTLLSRHLEISDLNCDVGGRTPLHLAAAWGIRHRFPKTNHTKSFKKLSCEFVSVNESDHKLIFENIAGNEILKYICATNKFPSQADKVFGWFPVDYAVRSYSLDTLNSLLDNEQFVDFSGVFHNDSLTLYSVKYGYKNILLRLPLKSYIYNLTTLSNLLHVAAENENDSFDVLKILLQKYDPKIIRLYLLRMNLFGASPLMSAALNGNVNVFETLLQYTTNIDLNGHNIHGLNLLHCLVFYNYKDCLEKLLLNPNIDINKETKSYGKQVHTALYLAINNNNIDIVKILIENGADITLTYENKRTVLHVASVNGFSDCIKELHYNGADINSSDENGKTSLHYAAQNSKPEGINCLLQLGADVNKRDVFGRTFLHYAVQNFRLEELEFRHILTLEILNAKDKDGKTMIHYAVKKLKMERINYLLQLGKNDSNWHRYGSTPIFRASKGDRFCNIKLLIHSEANINETDNCGRTALQYAVEEGDTETLACLLELKADINKIDKDGRTPLYNAVRFGKINVIKCLLNSNSGVDKCDALKKTPLHVAVARKGFVKCVHMLVTYGANINLSTSDGCTPLFIAIMQNNEKLVKLLIEYGANVNKFSQHSFKYLTSECSEELTQDQNSLTPLHVAIQLKNIKIIKYILESKVKINQTDSNGWTALHFAVSSNCVECIEDLINKGASLHLQNSSGRTAIHLATEQNNSKMLQSLLGVMNCKKAINKFDTDGHTAVHVASSNGYFECVGILVNKGADVDVRTNEGFTPLDLAIRHGHADVQKFLEDNKTILL